MRHHLMGLIVIQNIHRAISTVQVRNIVDGQAQQPCYVSDLTFKILKKTNMIDQLFAVPIKNKLKLRSPLNVFFSLNQR